jgi:hypothetical protein
MISLPGTERRLPSLIVARRPSRMSSIGSFATTAGSDRLLDRVALPLIEGRKDGAGFHLGLSPTVSDRLLEYAQVPLILMSSTISTVRFFCISDTVEQCSARP